MKFQEKIAKQKPFAIPTKKKYLGINLTKDVKNLYAENYKALLKEIEKRHNEWKDLLCSWIERINIVKMSILLNIQYTNL